MGEIEEEIAAAEGGAEVLGLEGRVDEAQAAVSRCEGLRREMDNLQSKALGVARDKAGRKHMIVCDVSGNFMNSTDNGERLRSHFEGKQFQGWKLIRKKLKVPPDVVTDKDINKLLRALDDDGSGTLDIEELSDFVIHGSATFFAEVRLAEAR